MYELVRTQLYLNMVKGVDFTINYMFWPLYWPSSFYIPMYELVRTQLYLNMVQGVDFTINYMFRPLYWPSSFYIPMSALKLANGIEDVPGFSQFLHCPKIKAYFSVLPNSRFTRIIKFLFIIYSLFHDAVRNTNCISI